MDLKQIEKLMSSMEHARIRRIFLKKEDFEIEIERECAPEVHLAPPHVAYATQPSPQAHVAPSSPFPAEVQEKTAGVYVTSPMVGTFYFAPSPEDPPFIKVGDIITEESVVCIIEAMKVMNEIKAGVRGTVAEVLLKNGVPVEFGTQILRVIPA